MAMAVATLSFENPAVAIPAIPNAESRSPSAARRWYGEIIKRIMTTIKHFIAHVSSHSPQSTATVTLLLQRQGTSMNRSGNAHVEQRYARFTTARTQLACNRVVGNVEGTGRQRNGTWPG